MTIFQKIIDREIPAEIVYEDDLCLAFHDVNPQAPVHVLLIPKEPIESLNGLGADHRALIGHMMLQLPALAKQLQIDSGYRTVINTGSDAGQTVFHLHIHLMGGRGMNWPPG